MGRKANQGVEQMITDLQEEGRWIHSGEIAYYNITAKHLVWPISTGRIVRQEGTVHGGRTAYGLPSFKPLQSFDDAIIKVACNEERQPLSEFLYMIDGSFKESHLRRAMQELRAKGILLYERKLWSLTESYKQKLIDDGFELGCIDPYADLPYQEGQRPVILNNEGPRRKKRSDAGQKRGPYKPRGG
jgi:hypothetical protein